MFIAFSVLRGHSVTPLLDSYFFFSFVIDICSDEIYLFYFNNNGILKKYPKLCMIYTHVLLCLLWVSESYNNVFFL